MNRKKNISILGCGWLGFPLAKMLVSKGYAVKGSTTSATKLQNFADAKIVPYLVQFSDDPSPENLPNFLEAQVLVIAIPPGRKNPDKNSHFKNMAEIVAREVKGSAVKKLIFVSSTSVYGDRNQEVDEYTLPKPDDASGELLLEVENLFTLIPDIQICILRLSGLIGPSRHPARFFVGKQNVPNGLAPVNLIHLDDATGIILKLIEIDDACGVYVGSSPTHPTKQEFYTLAAKQAGLEPPTFLNELNNWKIVNSSRISTDLGYPFIVQDLLKWVSSS